MSSKVGPEHLRDFERRRSLRFVLPHEEDITVTLDGRQYHGKLEDVSIGGAKLRFSDDLPASAEVHLEHSAAGAIEGTCMWHQGRYVGIAFGLTDPALRLISLCLRQGVPSGNFAA
ncbi:MAG: PilZ domain-containing protein [Kiloniellaceae bacterium]